MIRCTPVKGGKQVKVSFVVPEDGMAGKALAVVGDFNDWDPTATPMRPGGNLRSATITLPAGERYAFLERVQAMADGGARSVVVDLGGALVDAHGLDALVGASALLDRFKGEIVLRSPRSDTLKHLDLAGLGGGFVVC